MISIVVNDTLKILSLISKYMTDWDVGDVGGGDWDDDPKKPDANKKPAFDLGYCSDVKFPEKPLREEMDRPIIEEVVSLKEAISDLSDMRYELLGHGTSSESSAKSIIEEGLFVKDSAILSNASPLFREEHELKECLDSWRHRDSKHIALLRFPVKYKLPFSFSEKMYGVFFEKRKYEREYIYGYYDANTGMVHKNPRYRGNLDKEEDVKYMETVYSNICDVVLDSLRGDMRESWDQQRKTFYDYKPGEKTE